MNMKVILKHYCETIMTFLTTIETKSSKLIFFAPPIIGSILKRINNIYNVIKFSKI